MISVFVGLVFILLGGWGVARWYPEFVSVVRGLVPVSILLGGVVAVVTGLSSLQPRRRSNETKK